MKHSAQALIGATLTLTTLGCSSSDPAPYAGSTPTAGATHALDAGAVDVGQTADGGQAAETDAAPPVAVVHSAEDRLACERELEERWASEPPVTGLGPAAARASYAQVIGNVMADYAIPGGAVAVTRNGRLALVVGLGLGDREEQQPAHADQLFRIASLSKQLTATAILRLVEDNQLSLDDPVFDILTGYDPLPGSTVNPELATITIRNLLQHTGGWNRDFEAIGDPMFRSQTIAMALGEQGPADEDMIIRYMLDKPLTYTPGTTMCYSNFGYALLGRVIARTTGMPYEAYLQQQVLAPAGIRDMKLGHTLLEQRADGEVRYYGYPGEALASSIFPEVMGSVPWEYGGWNLEAMAAHGGWIASPIEMLRFQLSIDQQPTPADQISAASEQAMLENPNVPSCRADGGTNPTSATSWYGFGLSVNSAGNYWHTGSLDGTSTEDVIASNGFAWSAFFNTRSADFDGLVTRLDMDLWTALDGANDWSDDDLFTQYPAFSEWTTASAFQAVLADAQDRGKYPSRVEGKLDAGDVTYRARFAPVLTSDMPEVGLGLDCVEYVQRQTRADREHQALVSLQSYRDPDGTRRYQAVWNTP